MTIVIIMYRPSTFTFLTDGVYGSSGGEWSERFLKPPNDSGSRNIEIH